MKNLTMEQINAGLKMNGAIAGRLNNARQENPTLAINKELKKMAEQVKKETVIIEAVQEYKKVVANTTIPNVDDCVEIITEKVEWVKDSFDLIYGTSYEGGIRYEEELEPLMTW